MPSYSTLTLTDHEASNTVEALGRVREDTMIQELDDLLGIVQAKITEGRYVADYDKLDVLRDLETTDHGRRLLTVRLVLAQAHRLNDKLNDPHGDESGRDAESPTGDSYNELLGLLEQLDPFNGPDIGSGGSTRDIEVRKAMLRVMLHDGMTQVEVLDVLHERGTGKEGVSADKAIEAASNTLRGDDISVDGNALFSETDGGLWVQGWIYVTDDELGLTEPLPEKFQGKLWHVDLRLQPAYQAVPVESMSEAIDLHDQLDNMATWNEAQRLSARLVACATPEEAVALTKLSFDASGAPAVTECWQDSDMPGYGFGFITTDPAFLPSKTAE